MSGIRLRYFLYVSLERVVCANRDSELDSGKYGRELWLLCNVTYFPELIGPRLPGLPQLKKYITRQGVVKEIVVSVDVERGERTAAIRSRAEEVIRRATRFYFVHRDKCDGSWTGKDFQREVMRDLVFAFVELETLGAGK